MSYSHTPMRQLHSMMESTKDDDGTSYNPSGKQAYHPVQTVQTHSIMFAY